jgi:peptidoglycan hydrolase CwlO-like protein
MRRLITAILVLSFTIPSFAQDCEEKIQQLANEKAQLELYQEELKLTKDAHQQLEAALAKAREKSKYGWVWLGAGVLSAASTLVFTIQSVKAFKAPAASNTVKTIKVLLGLSSGVGSFFFLRKMYLDSAELEQLEFEMSEAQKILDVEQAKVNEVLKVINELEPYVAGCKDN